MVACAEGLVEALADGVAEALADGSLGVAADALALALADGVALADADGVLLADADGVALADALALDDGSSLLGVLAPVEPVPLIEAANAVRCVRTSCSLLFALSSSVAGLSAGLALVEPEVPVALPAPMSSPRMRSAAATSVLQFALVDDLPADADDEDEEDDEAFASVAMCRLSSATLVLVVPVSDAAGISFNAASALLRCSLAEPF